MENANLQNTVSQKHFVKKALSILLSFIMLFSITAGINFSAYADSAIYSGICGEKVIYELNTLTGQLTISGTGKMKNYSGISSAAPWDSDRKIIKSVVIENGVTSIGQYGFYFCKNIEAVSIANTVESIGDNAFHCCSNLKTVIIPNGVKNIGKYAFYECTNLTKASIGNSVINIGNCAFSECVNLNSLSIGNSVETIGWSAFKNCASLISVTIPNSVTSIDSYAFDNCTSMENIFIENKDCTIEGFGGSTIPKNAVIHGYKNSTAENYAKEYNRTFISINCKHSYDEGCIIQFATCTANGAITYTCPTCGATKIETIKATGHKAVTDKAIAATCTKSGKTAGSHCSVCNAVITAQKTVAATGHTYDDGKVTKAATCTANGVKTYTCTKCKATKTETIKATGHGYKTTVTKATTSKNGNSVTKCTKCGTVSKKSTIAYPKTVTLSATAYTYDGKAKKPTVTVKDSAGKTIAASNYTVAYSNNTNVGTATVKVTFKGNYSGSISKTFKINPKNTSISSVSALYKGFTVKYAKQATQTTGYQIQYSTSSNFSNAKTVTINKNSTVVKNVTGLTAKKKYYVRIRTYKTVGKTNYYSAWSGSKNVTTSSYPTSISLSATSYTYDGKVKKPSVTVKHGSTKIASKYYTVSYSGERKNVGTYTVTIKFKAPYSGTVKKTFKINPKNTSISSLSAQSKAFTVKLKKYTTQTTGYQIQYSTSSNFKDAKTVTIKNTTTSKKVTGLTGNKKYYVRIRTYKTVGKTNYYSGWTKAKTVTTKK